MQADRDARRRTQRRLLAALLALSALNSVLGAYAVYRGAETLESTGMAWFLCFSILAGLWLRNDIAERRPERLGVFPDYFIFLFWPLVIPWHFLSSRGIRGLVPTLGLFGTYLAPELVGLVFSA